MTTLLYGSIIQIRSTETIYENKLFYVERLDEDELVLKANDGNILILPIEDGSLGDSITEIVIVYKPLYGYSIQNKLYKSQWLEIEFEDQTVKGQIVKADTIIEVLLTSDETVYIPVERGLPKNIKIKKISKPRESESESENKSENEIDAGELEESPNNGSPLGFIESLVSSDTASLVGCFLPSSMLVKMSSVVWKPSLLKALRNASNILFKRTQILPIIPGGRLPTLKYLNASAMASS